MRLFCTKLIQLKLFIIIIIIIIIIFNNEGFGRFVIRRRHQCRPSNLTHGVKQLHPCNTTDRSEEESKRCRAINQFYQSRKKEIYGGKRWVLSWERKDGRESQKRKSGGRAFQTVGAQNEKERRPMADLTRGIVRRRWSVEQRLLEDVCG